MMMGYDHEAVRRRLAELSARRLEIGLAARCGHCWTPLDRDTRTIAGVEIKTTTCPTCDRRDWRDDA